MKNYLNKTFDLDDPKIVSAIDELPLWSAPFGMKLLDNIPMKKGINVLDIGSGLGFPLLEIAMRLGKTSSLYGIDPWGAGIERAKSKIRRYGIRNVKLIKGLAEEMPFEDNFFDMIISNNGLNNVQDLNAVLDECKRVGKDQATIHITQNLPGSMIEFYNIFEDALRTKGMEDEIRKMKAHIQAKRKPLDDMSGILNAHGIIIEKSIEDSFHIRFFDGSAMLNHFFIILAFMNPWKDIMNKDIQEDVFVAIENSLNKHAKINGELKLTIPYVYLEAVLNK